jgi:hypothetical protein
VRAFETHKNEVACHVNACFLFLYKTLIKLQNNGQTSITLEWRLFFTFCPIQLTAPGAHSINSRDVLARGESLESHAKSLSNLGRFKVSRRGDGVELLPHVAGRKL